MISQRLNVLFVDKENTSTSIFAEKLLHHWGGDRFNALSAGIGPIGNIDPLAIQVLQRKKLATEGLASKSFSEILKQDTPAPDFVISLIGKDEFKLPAKWMGNTILAYWNLQSMRLSDSHDDGQLHSLRQVCNFLENRIKIFANLKFTGIIKETWARKVNDLGNYNLGNQLLDNQHQIFLLLSGQLSSAMKDGEPHELLVRIAYQIQKYALFHFFSEENYMSETGFPDLQRHCEQHTSLIAELSDKLSMFVADQHPDEDIGIFLEEWFLRHTIQDDADFVTFLQKSGLTSIT